MKVKRFYCCLLAVLLVLGSTSCSDIYSALGKLGSALDKSGTNVLGLGGPSATKQASEAKNAIFDGTGSVFSSPAKDSEGNPDASGKTKLDKVQDGIQGILDNIGEKEDGSLDWTGEAIKNGESIDYDKLMADVLDGLIMDKEGWDAVKESIGELTSTEAKQKFADSMREDAGLEFTFNVEGKSLKDYTAELKNQILGDSFSDPDIKDFVVEIVDTLITDDGGITKGSVLILSSIATVANNIKQRTEENGENFDPEHMNSDQIKDSTTDLLDFVNITMAVMGPKSKSVSKLDNLITNKIK